ncbi:hypothetical protein ACE1ET_11670 [Saccharicrinis sp. FJH62]|uniref:hypothetical protein n=1 Tax=Saccharicrinis sp. FJH62 TaxID=3344657 RepID=UPI0035D46400
MKRNFKNHLFRYLILISVLVSGSLGFMSCKDPYIYDNKEPDWLGASIYDYLKENGNYTNYVKIIEDVGYTEVLRKTGSKTLFVADDDAFARFYQNNEWGVTSYADLSHTQKKLILNFSMINNAYLIETLSNYYNGELNKGQAIRRETALTALDTVYFDKGDDLPDTKQWTAYKTRGIHLFKDNTTSPLVHFLEKQLSYAAITNEDFFLITGKERQTNDAFIFDKKVIERDITCKNGYINVLEDVLVPPVNMAEFLMKEPRTSEFSTLLERFSAPYYDGENTDRFNNIDYNEQNNIHIDSIYVKEYFSENGGTLRYPNGRLINTDLLLPYNPGWNSYNDMINGTSLQADMGAIFAPTDEAMDHYFNVGAGKILKDRFGSWANVPDDITVLFLQRHLRTSLLASTPSRFDKMTDTENSVIYAGKDDIVDTYVGVNGVVYLMNNVYPPDDYISVYAPVLFSEKTKVFNWAIRQNDFRLYLNSLISRYSFFVPTDEYLKNYIDPVAFAKDKKGALQFRYDEEEQTVLATVYAYDAATNTVGDSIASIEDPDFISNRLLDMLNTNIVVNGVEDADGYYLTKGGNVIKVEGAGSGLNMVVQGGGDIERNDEVNIVDNFEVENGYTYFIDKPIQTPTNSVYKTLSETPEFSAFFELLSGFPETSNSVFFVKRTNYFGIDFTVKFLNTFNYTIYVPTNDAIAKAIQDSIIQPWDDYVVASGDTIMGINSIEGTADRNAAIVKLERFLRYHFQDNSVFIGGKSVDEVYQSSTIKLNGGYSLYNTYKNKYYKIGVVGDGSYLNLTTESEAARGTVSASVIVQPGLYNLLARDYIFNADPQTLKEVDGTGASGAAFSTSQIYTSATAVIHQIDNVLRFETNEN